MVASSKNPAAVIEKFLLFPLILSSQMNSPHECVAQFADGAQVSLIVVPPEEFAVSLFVRTGSEAHIEKVMEYAAK